jgi:hypothetical protein
MIAVRKSCLLQRLDGQVLKENLTKAKNVENTIKVKKAKNVENTINKIEKPREDYKKLSFE